MTRWLAIAVVGWCCGFATAADDKADRAVDAVLTREAHEGVVKRADDLASVFDAPRARWAAGYISEADGWHSFDTAAIRLSADPAWQEYLSRRGTNVLNLQQHLELASWCAEHGLRDQQRSHLWGALIFNPKQPAVWQKLGYHNLNGEWFSDQDEHDQKARQKKAERDYRVWIARAQSLQKRLAEPSPGTQAAAREQLKAIKDAAAVSALEAMLAPTSQEVALDFVNWARGINRVETTMALARQAVISPWEPVREMAIEGLRTRRLDHYAPVLLSTLVMPTETEVATGVDLRRPFQPVFVATSRRELQNCVLEGYYRVDLGLAPVFEVRDRVILRPYSESIRVARKGYALPSLRDVNDFNRVAAQTEEVVRNNKTTFDAAQEEWNRRVAETLTRAGEVPTQITARQWWEWWGKLAGIDVPSDYEKPVEPVYQRDVVPSNPIVNIFVSVRLTHSCLQAGTPIVTEIGPKAIEQIRIGDRVLSKDIVTGELAFRPVLQTTVRTPQPLKTLRLGSETISATLGHYFWVSGHGWRMARELQPGDRLHGVSGSVELVEVGTGEVAPVYNLVVERANTYFVGNSQILSHDVTPPSPTNIIVPGLAAR